jgi:hypothetical protein
VTTGNEFPKTDLHEVTKFTLFNVQVCSLASEDDALAWVRSAYPSGTTGNWNKTDEERYKPVACANGGGRTHYVFVA